MVGIDPLYFESLTFFVKVLNSSIQRPSVKLGPELPKHPSVPPVGSGSEMTMYSGVDEDQPVISPGHALWL